MPGSEFDEGEGEGDLGGVDGGLSLVERYLIFSWTALERSFRIDAWID
jgi:hypothetical protein